MRLPDQPICQAKRGLLHLRECGKPALSSCQTCGTGLCEHHQVLTEYGVFCPDCAARDGRFNDLEDDLLTTARFRIWGEDYYDGSYPFVFTDTDFGTFDAQTREGGESPRAEGVSDAGFEGEDDDSGDDLDSSMES